VLAEGVTPFALSALKYALFALLFLFIWRSMRWIVRGLAIDQTSAGPQKSSRKKTAASEAPPAKPTPMTVVVHPSGGGKPKPVRLDTSAVIGRGAECELRLDDTYISQQHARIFGRNGSWYIEDLGSTNGTFVNEQKLAAPAMIQGGDRIRVGTTTLEVRR
jgi:pSer/pThr/pTyr-binding forkhead associated (FHA) protein